MNNLMNKYIKLLEEFVANKITADEFEQQFLQLFKADNNIQPEREFQILDKLFGDVDAYYSDSALFDPEFDIDGVQLQVSAQETLNKLVKLIAVQKCDRPIINNPMDKYNKILIKIHDDIQLEEYYIQVTIGGKRPAKEELNLLAKFLWEYSWEVEGTFLAENNKYFQDWYFELSRTVAIEEVAKNLYNQLEIIFPNKVGLYE